MDAGSGHSVKAKPFGAAAGLDGHALASGLIHSRATDEEASGGGSVSRSVNRPLMPRNA